MNTPEEALALAKQIFALKAALIPDWDRQKQARDALDAAMQFNLAVAALNDQSLSPEVGQPPAATAPPPAPPDQPAPAA
jgi:hypothetical protein